MSHLRHFCSKENRRALLLQEPQRIFYFFYFMVFEVIAWQWERTTLKATWFPGPLLLRPLGPSKREPGNKVVLRVYMVWQVYPCFSFPTDWRKCPHHNMYDKREPCGIHERKNGTFILFGRKVESPWSLTYISCLQVSWRVYWQSESPWMCEFER